MKICCYEDAGGVTTTGLVVGDGLVVPLRAASQAADRPEWSDLSSVGLLELDAEARRRLADAAELLAGEAGTPLDDLRLAPPVPDAQKIICLGLNYRDHADEAGLPIPKAPILFAKFREALIGHGATVVPPPGEHDIDYEAELAVVIGRGGRHITRESALDHVGGYMPFNDVSARDLQTITPQWMAGKAIDTFAPCGPYLTTSDAVDDPHDLRIRARVNGATVQDGNTGSMIFSIAEQIEYISMLMTLNPGDIIATGTPAGVGFTREPPLLLGDGDVCEIEIEGLGVLRNTIGAAAPDGIAAPVAAVAEGVS